MKGTVYKMNPNRGMIAIKVAENDFTIIKASLSEFEIEDEVRWNTNHELGSGTIYNISQNEEVEVFFENHNVQNGQLAKQLMF